MTARCGVASWGVAGPYFFREGDQATAVTGARYRQMLRRFLLPKSERHHVPVSSVWFQHDGAKPQTAASTLAEVQGISPEMLLSKGGSVERTPRFPGVSLPGSSLWGLAKPHVYRTRVPSLVVLKRRILAAVRRIPHRTLRKALGVLSESGLAFACTEDTSTPSPPLNACPYPLCQQFGFGYILTFSLPLYVNAQ